MIDLNELIEYIAKDEVDKNRINIVKKDNQITDFLLDGEKLEFGETVEVMTLEEVLKEISNCI